MNATLRFSHVSKSYRTGRERSNLRASLPRRVVPRGDDRTVLRDVSFALEPGEGLGVIGRNGAGKSTILKLASNITMPSTGRVEVHGKLAPLIELGVGFHPDMSGRDNVVFAASILGMRPKEIGRRLEQIVDFADIGASIDLPIKRYSTGMVARLGFATATHVHADILILDEVLAVGDAEFQRRCYRRIQQLVDEGITLLYATHAVGTVPYLCSRAIYLDQGRVVASGNAQDVVDEYERSQEDVPMELDGAPVAVLHSLSVDDRSGCDLTVDIEFEFFDELPDSCMAVVIVDPRSGRRIAANTAWDVVSISGVGRKSVSCGIGSLPLESGEYDLVVALYADRTLPVADAIRSRPLSVTTRREVDAQHGKVLHATWDLRTVTGT